MSTWLEVAAIAVYSSMAALILRRVWARRTNLADQLSRSSIAWVLTSVAFAAVIQLAAQSLPTWMSIVWIVFTVAGVIGMPVAAAVIELHSLRRDNQRRRAFGQTPRIFLLPARAVGVGWVAFLLLTMICVPLILDALLSTASAQTVNLVIGMYFGGLVMFSVIALAHTQVIQPRRIAAEERRIRSADLHVLSSPEGSEHMDPET